MKPTLQTTIVLDLRSQVMNSARSYIAKHLVNTVDSRFLYNMFIFGELNNILATLRSQTHGSIDIGTSL